MSKFRADCSSCCGLCCVAPVQLSAQGFGADKPAATPCRHLNEQHRCAIYRTRAQRGYPACLGFDCYGAGQRVSGHLFGRADWRDSPDLAAEMFAAYRYWLPRFRAAALIEAALPYVRAAARPSLVARMEELVSAEAARDAGTDGQSLHAGALAAIRNALQSGAGPDDPAPR